MREPGGDALRRRIDEMSNEEYQALIRLRDGAELRRRLADVPDATEAQEILLAVAAIADEDLPGSSPTSPVTTCRACSKCWAKPTPLRTPRSSSSPTPSSFGLPLAGDPLNHSMLLTQTQMDELRAHLGVPEDDIWAAFPPDSPEGLLCAERGAALPPPTVIAPPLPASVIPESLGATRPGGDLDAGGDGPGPGAAGGSAGSRRADRDPSRRMSRPRPIWRVGSTRWGSSRPRRRRTTRRARSGCCAGCRDRRDATSSSVSPR